MSNSATTSWNPYTNDTDWLSSMIGDYLTRLGRSGDSVYLTGSRARGDYCTNTSGQPSDIDLVVVSHSAFSDASPIYGLKSYVKTVLMQLDVEVSVCIADTTALPSMRSNLAADLKDFALCLWGSSEDAARITYSRSPWDNVEVVAHQAGHLLASWYGGVTETPASNRAELQRADKMVLEVAKFYQPSARTYRELEVRDQDVLRAKQNRYGTQVTEPDWTSISSYIVEFCDRVDSLLAEDQLDWSGRSEFEVDYVRLVLALLAVPGHLVSQGEARREEAYKIIKSASAKALGLTAVHTTAVIRALSQEEQSSANAHEVFAAMTRDFFNIRHMAAFGANLGGAS